MANIKEIANSIQLMPTSLLDGSDPGGGGSGRKTSQTALDRVLPQIQYPLSEALVCSLVGLSHLEGPLMSLGQLGDGRIIYSGGYSG